MNRVDANVRVEGRFFVRGGTIMPVASFRIDAKAGFRNGGRRFGENRGFVWGGRKAVYADGVVRVGKPVFYQVVSRSKPTVGRGSPDGTKDSVFARNRNARPERIPFSHRDPVGIADVLYEFEPFAQEVPPDDFVARAHRNARGGL